MNRKLVHILPKPTDYQEQEQQEQEDELEKLPLYDYIKFCRDHVFNNSDGNPDFGDLPDMSSSKLTKLKSAAVTELEKIGHKLVS